MNPGSHPRALHVGVIAAIVAAAVVHAIGLSYLTSSRVAIQLERIERRHVGDVVHQQVKEHLGNLPLFDLLEDDSTRSATAAALFGCLEPVGAFRIKVYGPDGTILWSDEPALIGRRFPDNHLLDRALAGEIVSKVEAPERTEHVYERGSADYIVETYVPLMRGTTVTGVIEVYRHSDEAIVGLGEVRAIVWSGAALATLALCLVIFFIMDVAYRREVGLQDALLRRGDELAREKEVLENILDGLGVDLALLDLDLKVIWQNRPSPLSTPLEGEEHPARMAARMERPVEVSRVTTDEGGKHWVRVHAWPMTDSDGSISSVLQLVEDVTQTRHLQAQVQHQEKLAAVGRMAAGIAHEVGNPLASLSGLLQLLGRRADEPSRKAVQDCLVQVERINTIVRSVDGFARPSAEEGTLVDLRSVVKDALEVFRLDARAKDIKIDSSVPDQPLIANGSEGRLIQVLINLFINACDAMNGPGYWLITSSSLPNASVRLRVAASIRYNGSYSSLRPRASASNSRRQMLSGLLP